MRMAPISAVVVLLSVVEAVSAAVPDAADFSGTTGGIAFSDSMSVNSGSGTIMGRSIQGPVSLFPTTVEGPTVELQGQRTNAMTTVSGTSSVALVSFSAIGSSLNVVQPDIVAFQAGIGTALPGIGAPLPSIDGLQPSIGQPTFMLNTGQAPFFPGSLNTVGTSIGSLVILAGNLPNVAASVPFLIVPLTNDQTNLTSVAGISVASMDPARLVNPEPGSVFLFATGVAGLAVMRRWGRRRERRRVYSAH